MDFQNFWFSSGATGGGGDPGDPIGESLRFRGAQFLINTSLGVPNNDFTYSMWMKSAITGSTGGLIGSNTGVNDGYSYVSTFSIRSRTAAGWGTDLSDGLLRDPSAWYHLVFQNNSGTTTLFINGVQQSNTSATFASTTTTIIGAANNNVPDEPFVGYMADIYMIDGQSLEPTAFGRFNDNGVWVPVDYSGTYGNNGFHLDFADPDNVGLDTSGNGNNFTATGFDTAPIGIFSNQIFTAPDQAAIPVNPTNQDFNTDTPGFQQNDAFNGDNSDGALSDEGAQSWIQFRPNTAIRAETSVVIRLSNTQTIAVNGVDTTLDQTTDQLDNVDISAALTFPVDLATVSIRGTELNNPRLCTIIVDGTELTDNTGVDYDSMQDSPTQNYATWNPLVPGRSSYVTDANLRATAVGTTHGNCQTIDLNDGNSYYWEWTSCSYTSNASGWVVAGTLPFRADFPDNSMRWSTVNRNFNNPTTHGTYSSLTITGDQAIAASTTYGFTYNNGTLQVLSNGAVTCTISGIPTDEGFYFGSGDNANASTSSINFGQQPFLFAVPDGFSALQTQNLPAATIANGRDHFQALTGPGAGGFYVYRQPLSPVTTAQSAANFNDLVGVASQTFTGSSASDAFIFDTVEEVVNTEVAILSAAGGFWGGMTVQGYVSADGTENSWTQVITDQLFDVSAANTATIPAQAAGYQFIKLTATTNSNSSWGTNDGTPILQFAQNTFPNGLWWIKDMDNTNNHQLLDSVRGGDLVVQANTSAEETTYTTPSGDSVAWCWNVDEAASANGNGSIASQVAANTTAGFSIVTYTGNGGGNAATIGHGLGAIPEFMLVKRRDATAQWSVYHVSVGNERRLILNEPDSQAQPDSIYWDNTTPTTQVFSVGSVSNPDPSGNFVAYCWAPIPGYSAFGSYDGNSSTDGPFIYTGHRSAFILIKASNADNNWTIFDSTRSPTNPAQLYLMPDTTAQEGSDLNIDILSNGFKLRQSSSQINNTGTQYIWASFAENPFGGSNVSPANAR